MIACRPAFNGGNLFEFLFSFFCIVPEVRGLRFLFFFFDQGKLIVDVKDTSPGRWYALLTL